MSQLAQYSDAVRACREAGNGDLLPCPARIEMYKRLIDRHGAERVKQRIECLDRILTLAELKSYAPKQG